MRILLADDHPMIRTALEALLRGTAFEIVGMASTGEQALAEIDGAKPDILLLDLQMPGGTGMDVLRQVRSNGSKLKIVLLTAAIDDASLVEAKTSVCRAWCSRIPTLLSAGMPRSRRQRRALDRPGTGRAVEETERKSDRPSRFRPLTPRERQLINLVRKGMRNREIAEELGVTEGTIKVYMHAIFEKVGVSSRTELAIRADEFLTGKLPQELTETARIVGAIRAVSSPSTFLGISPKGSELSPPSLNEMLSPQLVNYASLTRLRSYQRIAEAHAAGNVRLELVQA